MIWITSSKEVDPNAALRTDSERDGERKREEESG